MSFILTTTRFTLREMSLDDLDFIAEMMADPEVTRFYPKQYTREESAEWIERLLARYERDGYGLWLVERLGTGEPVGQVGLLNQLIDGETLAEIGYLIHRPFWQQGFAYEAAAGVRDYAFRELQKPRVSSLIRPVNLPSQAVATKLGMQREERIVQHGGGDHYVFSMNRPD